MKQLGQENIRLADITVDTVSVRPVDKKSSLYAELVNSIRQHGVLQPVLVRPDHSAPKNHPRWILIDGGHRYEAAREIEAENSERSTIPAMIVEPTSTTDVLVVQMVNNSQRIATKPAQYATQIMRILSLDPSKTVQNVATLLDRTPAWVYNLLRVSKLPEEMQKRIDSLSITLANAIQLTHLPASLWEKPGEIDEWLTRAKTMDVQAFAFEVKQTQDALRSPRKTVSPEEYVPPPTVRRKDDIVSGISMLVPRIEEAFGADQIPDTVDRNAPEYIAGYAEALAWVLQQDNESITTARNERQQALLARQRKQAEAEKAKTRGVTSPITQIAGITPKGDFVPKGFAN